MVFFVSIFAGFVAGLLVSLRQLWGKQVADTDRAVVYDLLALITEHQSRLDHLEKVLKDMRRGT